MLKQSLIQEKLSDLAVASSGAQGTTGSINKSAKTAATSSKDTQSSGIGLVTLSKSGGISRSDNKSDSTDLLLPHMPQWPRVQMGTQQIHSNLKNNRLVINTGRDYTTTSASTPTSSTYINSKREKINYSPNNNNEDYTDGNETNNAANLNNENIDYDGIETVNYYSSKHYGFSVNNADVSNINPDNLVSNSFNNGSNNNNNFSNNKHNNSNNNFNAKSHLSFSSNITNNNSNVNNSGLNQNTDNYDPTMKLRYLEKSIKFIQQQHNETLTCLHQEIENLKNENRATRKSSASLSGGPSNSRPSSGNKFTNKNEVNLFKSDPREQKGFEKLIREASKETDLNKRLNDIKINYDQNKYEILVTKLKDAESKNEYLTNIINQLQSRRSVNSGYRPNVNVNSLNTSNSSQNTGSTNQNLISKLNLNHVYTIEPLLIKINDKDEPRAPNIEESESIIKKLFELYKQQKQQISNMKVVLKDMMQTENLSNQGMMMTKDILENPNKFNQYFLDNKLSIITPITHHNSNTVLNQHKYHSQLLATLNTNNLDLNSFKASSNLNLASSIHLPPLQTINPAKFPERQRRTQILQKQRLRKEYFH